MVLHEASRHNAAGISERRNIIIHLFDQCLCLGFDAAALGGQIGGQPRVSRGHVHDIISNGRSALGLRLCGKCFDGRAFIVDVPAEYQANRDYDQPDPRR